MLLDTILSDELARAMITVPTPSGFEGYCNTLKGFDDRLRAYNGRQGKLGGDNSSWRLKR